MMATTRMPAAACPYCKTPCDAATNINAKGGPPEAGDATICIECGLPSIFTDDGALRVPTQDEAQVLGQDLRIMLAGLILRRARREQ